MTGQTTTDRIGLTITTQRPDGHTHILGTWHQHTNRLQHPITHYTRGATHHKTTTNHETTTYYTLHIHKPARAAKHARQLIAEGWK